MAVYADCRHLQERTTASGEAIRRCRLSANEEEPFACPQGCLFKESRVLTGAGWTQAGETTMTNTADLLAALPPQKRKKPKPKKKRG